MKMLVVASNINFLDWLRELPYSIKVFQIDLDISRIRKAFLYATLKPKLRILSWKYDVIFCEFFDEFASIMSRVSSKPIYVRLHRTEAHGPTHLKTANFKNIKAIIAVSKYYKQVVSELVGDKVPIHVVPNGVDIEKFSYNPHIHRPLKICAVSNLIPRKRIFDLIVNNPDLKIDIGGKGEERRTLEDAINRFNSEAKLRGWVRLPEFYHQHDVFIMNSEDEGCPCALLEAMSCGLMPLSFAWHGVEEILPKENIYRNYDQMRQKISEMEEMSNPEISQIKRKMRYIVESKFSLEHQAKNLVSLFSQGGTKQS